MGTGCGKEGHSEENAVAGYAQTHRAVQTVLSEKTSASPQGRRIQEYEASVLDTIGRVLITFCQSWHWVQTMAFVGFTCLTYGMGHDVMATEVSVFGAGLEECSGL